MTPESRPALAADQLELWRGERHVLRAVSFRVEQGACLQVTGANGAGKTTLLRALALLTPLEAGEIRYAGQSVRADPAAYHRSLAYLAHDNALKGDLSAIENLRFSARMRRTLDLAQLERALESCGVGHLGAVPVRRLSAGQRRRVALARQCVLGCPLWLMDEPTANLDPPGVALVRELIGAHVAGGGIAIVATHHALGLDPSRVQALALA